MTSDREFPQNIAGWHADGAPVCTQAWSICNVNRDSERGELTLFSSEVTESESFRATFRRETALLTGLQHPHLAGLLDHGEFDGRFYCVFSRPPGSSYSEFLKRPRSFDECVDSVWQITSAIQHLHNSGLSHGSLTPEHVVVSEQVHACVIAPARQIWLVTAGEPQQAFSDRVHADLNGLAEILDLTAAAIAGSPVSDETDSGESVLVCDALTDLSSQLRSGETIARDVQGQLGNLLLENSGDAIEMIDDRSDHHHSRPSIVEDLFEESEPRADPVIPDQQSSIPICLIVVCAVVLVLLILWVVTR